MNLSYKDFFTILSVLFFMYAFYLYFLLCIKIILKIESKGENYEEF